MGITSCNCLRGDLTYVSKNNQKTTFDVILNNENDNMNMNNLEDKSEFQKEEESIKMARQHKKGSLEMEGECPGIEIASDQDIIRSNAKIEETEKRLGEFVIEDENLQRIYSTYPQFSILYTDNSIYFGTFNSRWKREGFGTLYLPDLSKYTGEFKDDLMNGKGRLIYPEGDHYEGDFLDNKFHGQGVIERLSEGMTFKGNFENDLKNGYGEEIRTDGSEYKGNYLDDLKNGKGKFKWIDGTLYEGDFNQNLMEGHGRIIYADQKIYLGEWKSNKIEGRGVFYWPDNQCYVGDYINDKKCGFGVFYFHSGKKFQGYWMNGKQHGFGICSLKDEVKLGEWRFGKKIRWIQVDFNNIEDEELKLIVDEIKSKSQECHLFLNQIDINQIYDDNIKEKLLSMRL